MKATALLLAALLSGCATWDDASMSNRLACTAAGDQALVVSMWGIVGVAKYIERRDAKAVCQQ